MKKIITTSLLSLVAVSAFAGQGIKEGKVISGSCEVNRLDIHLNGKNNHPDLMRNRVILDLEKKGYKINEGANSDDSITIVIGNIAQQMNQNKLKRILVKDAKDSIDKVENNVVNFFYDAGESIDGFMVDKFASITPTVRVVRQEVGKSAELIVYKKGDALPRAMSDKSVSGDIKAINWGLNLIPECR